MCSENGIIKSIKFGEINDNVIIESNSQVPKGKIVSKYFWIFTLDFFPDIFSFIYSVLIPRIPLALKKIF